MCPNLLCILFSTFSLALEVLRKDLIHTLSSVGTKLLPAFNHDREVYVHADKAAGVLLSFLRNAADYDGKPKDPLVVTALAAIRSPGPGQLQVEGAAAFRQDLAAASFESKDSPSREREIVSFATKLVTSRRESFYYSDLDFFFRLQSLPWWKKESACRSMWRSFSKADCHWKASSSCLSKRSPKLQTWNKPSKPVL